MRNVATGLLVVAWVAGLASVGPAQGVPRAVSSLTLRGATIKVEYGRRSLNGAAARQMLSEFQTGESWRLGADQPTTFATSASLQFAEATLPAGEYSLWMTRVTDTAWNLTFNRSHGEWGSDRDESQDLIFVPLIPSESPSYVERLTLTLRQVNGRGLLTMHWGHFVQTVGFQVQ